MPAWLGFLVFACGFGVAVTAIVITVVPALPRILAVLRRQPSPETAAQRWRRVHATGDRAQPFERAR